MELLAPDGLWKLARLLVSEDWVRAQGGGKRNPPNEMMFATIIYVLVSG
ncbi:hypothetical protein ABT272_42770 [Streptomyces sp900105245]|uniref:Transposase n=1 Tax=Streptomyces sp. 900105245 TaxID=3154379 RepID=A0ABV1ULC2_9ACTN